MCLLESKKALVAGDHILADIIPCIQVRSDERTPLKVYMASVDKVYGLDIEIVFSGHGIIFKNCEERINELKHHHPGKAIEITLILIRVVRDAYEVASEMIWVIHYDSWNLYPALQKWFAIGEAMAHLKYLEDMDVILKEIRQQKIIYSLKY